MKYSMLTTAIICFSGIMHCMYEQRRLISKWSSHQKKTIEIVDKELENFDLKKIPDKKRTLFFKSKDSSAIYFSTYENDINKMGVEFVECIEFKSQLWNVKKETGHEKQRKYTFNVTSTIKPRKAGDCLAVWGRFPYCMSIYNKSDKIAVEEKVYKEKNYNLIDQKDALFDYFHPEISNRYPSKHFCNYSFNKNGTLFVICISGKEEKLYNLTGLASLGSSRLYLCATNPIRIIKCLHEFDPNFGEKFRDIYMNDDGTEVLLSSQDGVMKFTPRKTIQEKIWPKMIDKFTNIFFEF